MKRSIIERALNEGNGVMRLAPNWVPRSFCRPGRRLRLHPDDYFALGTERGGIDERWFSSTTPADNGPGTPENQGLSFIVSEDGEQARLIDAVSEFKGEVIGEALYQKYGRWPMYSKFFDNKGPLPHHIHQKLPECEFYHFQSCMQKHPHLFPSKAYEQLPQCSQGLLHH